MKALRKYELNYLRHLYLKDLKENKKNNISERDKYW